MMTARWQTAVVLCLLSSSAVLSATLAGGEEASWAGFRGTGDSHTTVGGLPLTWGDDQHIVWNRPVEGYGQSSPVVWGDRVFVTSIKGEEKETLAVTCLGLAEGNVLWRKEFPASAKAKATNYISRGAPTPAVDGNRVYAYFESGDLFALTQEGDLAWSRCLTKDYGAIQGNHGLGSSPAQSADSLFFLVDHDGPSYLCALSKETGETTWKKDREARVSWSSPTVTAGPEGMEVLVSSNGSAEAFSAKTGDSLWQVGGLDGNTVASPSATADSVLIASSKPGNNLLIRRGGKGDVAATHVLWRTTDATSSFGSPVIHEGHAYFVSKPGVAYAVDLATGETSWTHRLTDSTWASPVAAGDRVYFFCKNGDTVVVKTGKEYEELAVNHLTIEGPLYGVAVAGGGFLIRTGDRVIFVRDPMAAAAPATATP